MEERESKVIDGVRVLCKSCKPLRGRETSKVLEQDAKIKMHKLKRWKEKTKQGKFGRIFKKVKFTEKYISY